jgi:hypothetical protein
MSLYRPPAFIADYGLICIDQINTDRSCLICVYLRAFADKFLRFRFRRHTASIKKGGAPIDAPP